MAQSCASASAYSDSAPWASDQAWPARRRRQVPEPVPTLTLPSLPRGPGRPRPGTEARTGASAAPAAAGAVAGSDPVAADCHSDAAASGPASKSGQLYASLRKWELTPSSVSPQSCVHAHTDMTPAA